MPNPEFVAEAPTGFGDHDVALSGQLPSGVPVGAGGQELLRQTRNSRTPGPRDSTTA